MKKLLSWWENFYEGRLFPALPAPYRINPCDAGAATALHVLGLVLSKLMVQCPCCSAVRMIALVLITASSPAWGLSILGAALVLAAVLVIAQGRAADPEDAE